MIVRVLGHPLHPMLVHFPIAFWTLGSACDALALLGVPGAWPLAWLALAIGVSTALLAAIAGVLDLARLTGEAERVATRHMVLMVSALAAYAASLLLRSKGWGPLPDLHRPAIMLGGLGFLLLAGGGHLGASLVYRYGAGHDKGGE